MTKAKAITLFAIPFAGGSSYAYRPFQKYIGDTIQFIPIELPGRGRRTGEPLLTNTEMLVEDIYQQIKEDIQERPYALFGHSMGGLLVYLLVHRLYAADKKQPEQLFISGSRAPQYTARPKLRYTLPKDDFLKEIKAMGGISDILFNDQEM
ncbi:thioesterase II family protein, partial [Magnetococcales bacterium HHB-1]